MLKASQSIFLLCVSLVALSGDSFACSCAPPPVGDKTIEEIRAERKRYFLNDFKGAVFIGKILKRELVIVNWVAKTEAGEPADSSMYRYTIRVKEYWLGVKSSTAIVYGEPAEFLVLSTGESYGMSSCGFKLKTGQTYFFTPRLNQNTLEINQCDFAGGGSDPKGYPATEFRKTMGEPKRF